MRTCHKIVVESSNTGINPLKTGKQFAMLPVRLLALPNSKLSRTEKLVWAIVTQATNGHTAWLSVAEIAGRLGLPKKGDSVIRALENLEKFSEERDGKVLHCGLIHVERRKGQTSLYSIVQDSLVSDLVDPGQFDRLVDDTSKSEAPFVQCPNWLLRRPEISLGAKLTYCQLAWFCWKKGESYPKVQTLMKRMGSGSRAIFEWIRELVAHGLIERTSRKDTSNRYTFLPHTWMEMCDDVTLRKRDTNHPQKGHASKLDHPQKGQLDHPQKGTQGRPRIRRPIRRENTVDPSIYQDAQTHLGIETLQTSDSGSEGNPDSSAHNADYRSRQGLVGFQGTM